MKTNKYINISNLPIDNIFQTALSDNKDDFEGALSLLSLLYNNGRLEAAVFLLGLLFNCSENDFDRRSVIIKSLKGFNSKAFVEILIFELKRVKKSNSSRKYITLILKILFSMPKNLIEIRFIELSNDKDFSHRMRQKFNELAMKSVFSEDDNEDFFIGISHQKGKKCANTSLKLLDAR